MSSKTSISTSDAARQLVALRARTKKATFFFTSFFVILFLIMAALTTYLLLDVRSESKAETASLHSPIAPMPNHTLTILQTAAEHLLNATSFLKSIPVLKNCSDRVNGSLVQIQYAIAGPSDDEMTRLRIGVAGWSLNECLNDLKKMDESDLAVREARAKVWEAWESVRECADLVAGEEGWRTTGKDGYWSEKEWMEWVAMVVLTIFGALEIAFIGFMLRIVCCL